MPRHSTTNTASAITGAARAANTNPRTAPAASAIAAARGAGSLRAGSSASASSGSGSTRGRPARDQPDQHQRQRDRRHEVPGAHGAVGRERHLRAAAAGGHAPAHRVAVDGPRRAEVAPVALRPPGVGVGLAEHEPGRLAQVELHALPGVARRLAGVDDAPGDGGGALHRVRGRRAQPQQVGREGARAASTAAPARPAAPPAPHGRKRSGRPASRSATVASARSRTDPLPSVPSRSPQRPRTAPRAPHPHARHAVAGQLADPDRAALPRDARRALGERRPQHLQPERAPGQRAGEHDLRRR